MGGVSSVNSAILSSNKIKNRYEIDILRTWDDKNWKIRFLKSLVEFRAKKRDTDLLHINVSICGSCFRKIIITTLIGSRPYIIHLHSGAFIDFYNSQNKLYKQIIKKMFARAKKIICVSNSLMNDVIKCFDLPKEKIDVIYNGVQLVNYRENKTRKPINVLYMGAITEERGINVFLDIAKHYLGDYHFSFMVAGNGNDFDWNKENVIFLGPIKGDKKEQILQLADIYINFSRYESFGISMVECMNHRVCIIGSDNGSIPEILGNGEYGYIARNINEIIERLSILSNDPTLLEEMQERAYKRSLDYSMKRFEERLIKIYDELMEQ